MRQGQAIFPIQPIYCNPIPNQRGPQIYGERHFYLIEEKRKDREDANHDWK